MFTVYIRTTSIPFDTAGLTHDHGRLPDELQFVKYSSMTWTHDSKGFFYQVSPNFRSTMKSGVLNCFSSGIQPSTHMVNLMLCYVTIELVHPNASPFIFSLLLVH